MNDFTTSPGWGPFDKASHPDKKRRKRVMRAFKIDEMSAVDTPAQEGAVMSIMKRAPEKEMMEKVLILTSINERHQHMVSIDFHTLEHGGGETSWASGAASETNPGSPEHQHSFVINPDGTITIAATNAHDHDVEMSEFMTRLRLKTALAVAASEEEDIVVLMRKVEEDKEFEASDFALVPDATDPETWKHRLVRRSGGNPDRRLVGTAVAALKMGKIPKDERATVIRRVRVAWTKSHRGKPRSDMPSVLKRASSQN